MELSPVAEALVRSVPAGVMVVGPDDRVVTANRAFLDLFRATADPTGRTLAEVAAAEPFRTAGALWDGDRHRFLLPGDRLIEGAWHRLPDGNGRAVTVSDLSAAAQIRRRLRQHNRALAEVIATKTELVSALLHELRTPLAAARSMAQLLPDPMADPLAGDAIRAITRNLDRINDVTDRIATVSGIENGTIDLARTVLDLPSVRGEAAARSTETLPDTEVSVSAEPGPVFGDRMRLVETFERLIAAVRAVGGSPRIEVRATRADGAWQISLPLPPDGVADRLFTATGPHSNATALMLARAVVGRHGGSVGIDSDDHGPSLTVHLPTADRIPLML